MVLAKSLLGGAAIGFAAMATPAHGFATQSTMLRPSSLGLRMVGTVSAPPAQKMSTEVVTEQKKVPKKNNLQETGELVTQILGAHFKPFSKMDVQMPTPSEARKMVAGRKGDSDRGVTPPMYRSPGRAGERVGSHSWEANEDLSTGLERTEASVLTAVGGTPVGAVSGFAVRQTRAVGLLIWSVFAAHIAAVMDPLQRHFLPVVPGIKGFNTKRSSAYIPPYTGPPAHPRSVPAPAAPSPSPSPAPAAAAASGGGGGGGDVTDVLARVRAMETATLTRGQAGAPPSLSPPPSSSPAMPVAAYGGPPAAPLSSPSSSPSSTVDDVLARVQAMEGPSSPARATSPPPAAYSPPSPPSPSSPPPSAAPANDIASVMARLRAMEEQAGK